jgi:alpha-glucosidase (family GH31 glycosyl hydrolase)
LAFKLSTDESMYGTGSRATPVNKRGQQFYSYNQPQYSYANGASTLNINMPVVISSKKYGIYVENRTAGYFDIGASNSSVFKYTVESGKISYYVITGNSYDEILNSYTDLTGKQPLPPRWALGYMQSRFGYQTETETRTTVDAMLAQDFPLDAIILDVYWFGALGDMGNLAWNNTNFPNSKTMMSDFKKKGVKTILISEPYVTQNSFNYSYCDQNLLFGTDNSGGYTYIVPDFFAGKSGILDVFKTQTKDWWWSKYKSLANDGVSGWWCDVGEPENHPSGMKHVAGTAREVHNVFALEWAGLLYNKYKIDFPNQRLFNLTRSGYAGMQRYSTFTWSGDVNRSWEGFQAQIPIMLGMSMCGVGYMHSDLGGFTGGAYNPELFTRWLQFGAFCPVMRPHGEGVGPEPIYYPETEKGIIRDYVKLRYQLMPYNYTLAWKNTETGRPLAMNINYFEPENASLSNVNDEYLWGENMLIAPVMTSGATSRNVLFPAGKWINYHTNQVYNGSTSTSVSASLSQMPIFVKAGSFLPMVPKYKTTDTYNTDTLLVKYYPDLSNSVTDFTMYDDNGTTPDANVKNEFELLTFSGEVLEHQTNIHLTKSGSGFVGCPTSRSVTFEIQRQTASPYTVLINGTTATIHTVEANFTSAESGYFYNSTSKVLYVKYLWTGSSDEIIIANDNLYDGIDENQYFAHYLQHAFPNPFKENTVVNYNILEEGDYTLSFYTSNGTEISKENLNLKPGSYSYNWMPKNLATGLYLISLEGKTGKEWIKVVKE